MTLTTHAIVGAAAAQFFPRNPAFAFFAGFFSHFIIDSLPHRDYKILSGKKENEIKDLLDYDMNVWTRAFVWDALRIGFDMFLGIILSIVIFTTLNNSSLVVALLGAIGGILPDPLQFVYWKTKMRFMVPLQRFHAWIQKEKPNFGFLTSVVIQIFMVIILISVVVYLTNFYEAEKWIAFLTK